MGAVVEIWLESLISIFAMGQPHSALDYQDAIIAIVFSFRASWTSKQKSHTYSC